MWVILTPIVIAASALALNIDRPDPYTDLDAFLEIPTE